MEGGIPEAMLSENAYLFHGRTRMFFVLLSLLELVASSSATTLVSAIISFRFSVELPVAEEHARTDKRDWFGLATELKTEIPAVDHARREETEKRKRWKGKGRERFEKAVTL